MSEITLSHQQSQATLTSTGGYITSWQIDHPTHHQLVDVLYRGSKISRTGIPTLFPNYGEGYMYHGFWIKSQCSLQQPAENIAVLSLDETVISEEAKQWYPYRFCVDVTIELETAASLVYTMRVKNNEAQQSLPIVPGVHPYWAVPHREKKKITTTGIPEFDAATCDWDQNPPDTVYDFQSAVRIVTLDRTIAIQDISPQPVIRHLVVWSQPVSLPDTDFVCFEPITGGDNAITQQPILVDPGQTWVMKLRFSCIL